jgi:hypothetical protein
MVRRADMILTSHAVATATKWVGRIVKKLAAISVPKVVTTMARVVIARRAADVGDKRARPRAMAHVAMPTKARDACVGKDHAAATARHEMATKAHAIRVQMARRVATDHPLKMALTVSDSLTATDHLVRPAAVGIRRKAATSPTLPCNSLSLAPGERVSWSQPTRPPGCFIQRRPRPDCADQSAPTGRFRSPMSKFRAESRNFAAARPLCCRSELPYLY